MYVLCVPSDRSSEDSFVAERRFDRNPFFVFSFCEITRAIWMRCAVQCWSAAEVRSASNCRRYLQPSRAHLQATRETAIDFRQCIRYVTYAIHLTPRYCFAVYWWNDARVIIILLAHRMACRSSTVDRCDQTCAWKVGEVEF